MNLFQKLVEGELTHLACIKTQGRVPDNPTPEERRSLKSLNDDKSIVIRNTDKRGSVAFLDSVTYENEALRQLSNTNIYCKLGGDPAAPFRLKLSNLLDRAVSAGIFTAKER